MWGQKYQSNEEEVEGSTKCSDNSGGKEKELADGVVSPSGRKSGGPSASIQSCRLCVF